MLNSEIKSLLMSPFFLILNKVINIGPNIFILLPSSKQTIETLEKGVKYVYS